VKIPRTRFSYAVRTVRSVEVQEKYAKRRLTSWPKDSYLEHWSGKVLCEAHKGLGPEVGADILYFSNGQQWMICGWCMKWFKNV
jgi:hypothetical protein